MVVCTTHFLEMFSMGVLNDGSSGIRALQMEVQIPENDREDAMPLFRLRAGVAKSSAGLTCAKISGVKQSVLERALEIVQTIKGERRIDPLMEVLRNQLPDHERETVAKFVCTDWNDADEETVQDFREQIESL
jgi:DNA mismatch repair protein MSH5